MGRTTRAAAAALVLGCATATATAAPGGPVPAGAQGAPPTRAVIVSFEGTCPTYATEGTTPPTPGPRPRTADLEVPTSVEPGATFEIGVTLVDGTNLDAPHSSHRASFAVEGATPDLVVTAARRDGFTPLQITATGAPGSDVTVRLTRTEFGWALPGGPFPVGAGYVCSPDGSGDVPVEIPIAVPECLGRPATIVAPADQAMVAGTVGDDVIVARAPAAVVRPGGGDDRVCALGGGATLDLGGARHGQFVALEAGRAFGAGGDTVQFSGVTRVQGSSRRDALVGSPGDDQLLGGAGDDVVIGLAGADLLDGQAGHDLLLGDDADTCLSGIALGCSAT